MQDDVAIIDIDAIPMEGMDLVWCRCIDCRHALPPSHGYPAHGCTKQPVDGDRDDTAWHWCGDYALTLAQGPRGQDEATRTPSDASSRDVGERGASGRPANRYFQADGLGRGHANASPSKFLFVAGEILQGR